jgi:hypothetical protein
MLYRSLCELSSSTLGHLLEGYYKITFSSCPLFRGRFIPLAGAVRLSWNRIGSVRVSGSDVTFLSSEQQTAIHDVRMPNESVANWVAERIEVYVFDQLG